MNKSIEKMMAEHQVILRVLGSLRTYADQLENPEAPRDRAPLARFARFFREFADHCHHGKEEDRLFVTMNQCGFPRQYGPLGVMLAEHEAGRAHVRALAELGHGNSLLSRPEIGQVRSHALEFVPLLQSHIMKEDNVLYPMAQQAIPPAQWELLDEACEAFDGEVIGHDEKAQLLALAEALNQEYPYDESCLHAAGCAGCCGH
jgi:hemerythrin-like domain-containing protein